MSITPILERYREQLTAVIVFTVHVVIGMRYAQPELNQDVVIIILDPLRQVLTSLSAGLGKGVSYTDATAIMVILPAAGYAVYAGFGGRRDWRGVSAALLAGTGVGWLVATGSVLGWGEAVAQLLSNFFMYPHRFQLNFYTGAPLFFLPLFSFLGSSPGIVRLLLIGCMAGASVFAFLAYKQIFSYWTAVIGILLLFNMNIWLVFRYADFTWALLFSAICLFLFARWRQSDNINILYVLAFLSGLFFYFKALVAYTVIALAAGVFLVERRKLFGNLSSRQILLVVALGVLGATPFWLYTAATDASYLGKATDTSTYAEGQTVADVVQIRLRHLTYLTSPDRFLWIDGPDQVFIQWMAILLAAGICVSIYFRRQTTYTAAFLAMFALLLYVPKFITFRQATPILLLVPIPILSLLPSRPRTRRTLFLVTGIVLAAGILLSVAQFDDLAAEAWAEESYKWGGDQESYKEFQRFNLSGPIVTNAFRPYMLSKYDQRIPHAYFLMPDVDVAIQEENWTLTDRIRAHDVRFFRVPVNAFRPPQPSTFVLGPEKECSIWEEFCPYNTAYLIDQYNLSQYPAQQYRLGNTTYTVIRDVSFG